MEEKESIPNERNADPQRGWSYVGSEKTSTLNMLNKDGEVPQDLEDEKVNLVVPQEQSGVLKCSLSSGALRLLQSRRFLVLK